MALCMECGGTGTIYGLGAMKIQCPICEGKRIVDCPTSDKIEAKVMDKEKDKHHKNQANDRTR